MSFTTILFGALLSILAITAFYFTIRAAVHDAFVMAFKSRYEDEDDSLDEELD